MKKIKIAVARVFTITAIVATVSCNSGDNNTSGTSDTAQPVPGTDDSVPSVVNPGPGDTSRAVNPPTTNDNNAIMPNDSTTINQ